MKTKHAILIVEDVISQALIYEQYLKGLDFEILKADTGKKAEEIIFADESPCIVLMDLALPDKNGMDILREMQEKEHPAQVIVITANGSLQAAIEAMQYGAYDFLVKPFEKEKLLITIKNAAEKLHLHQTIQQIQVATESAESFQGFIGSSEPMRAVYRQIQSAAPSKATVFITGESGTGKEVCARAIHDVSPRGAKPFVALNCGAIPKDLIESEVFGHVKGAFTGASADREGAAKRANGGSLFLDEICELDMNLQVKLLRFLQTGTFVRVGGDREEKVDIRIICATNRDPQNEVQAGRFREDLYYRLHVVPMMMPPLRARDRDIMELARHFLEAFSKQEGKQFSKFATEFEVFLQSYPWPGNVRELLNTIQNIVVLNDGAEVQMAMLPSPLDRWSPANAAAHPLRRASDRSSDTDAYRSVPFRPEDIRPLEEQEREIIEQAIRVCGGNIPKAALLLGINPSTIYRKKTGWEGTGTAKAS